MKKYTTLVLSLVFILLLTGCNTASRLFHKNFGAEGSTEVRIVDEEDLKIGFLFPLGADAPDTISHIASIRKMQQDTGLKDSQVLIVKNVSTDKYDDVIEKLIGKGCDLIIAKSSGAEEAMIKAAQNHPEVEFCQEDGRKVSKSGLSNLHSFYARLYEGYYAAGIAAGVKLNDLLNKGRISPESCVVGFAATRENPENISCINAFWVGISEVCTQASMMVRYADSSGDFTKDDECARQLIASGVRLMGQRVFTTAVASACAENDIPIVGNEINIIDVAPNEAITSVVVDWSVYYDHAVDCLVNGKEIDPDWVAGYEENVVSLSQFNDAHISQDTITKVADAEKKLRKGRAKIFKTKEMTVDGETVKTLIKNHKDFKKFKSYVSRGEFQESRKKSAPVMDFLIDGIHESTGNFLTSADESEEESDY